MRSSECGIRNRGRLYAVSNEIKHTLFRLISGTGCVFVTLRLSHGSFYGDRSASRLFFPFFYNVKYPLYVTLVYTALWASCAMDNRLSDTLNQEINAAMKQYKDRHGRYPQNENALFFQALIPYLGDNAIWAKNVKTIFVEIHSLDDSADVQKVPVYILINGAGKALKLVKKGEVEFELTIDPNWTFSDSLLQGKLAIGAYERPDPAHRDTTNFNYYYEQQLHYLKKGAPLLVASIEAYKRHYRHYPECCGKYFLGYLLPFMENNMQSIEYEFVTITNGWEIPIYRSSNANELFPFLSYCFDPVKNTYCLYFTGKNGVDERGLGDDTLLDK